MDVVPTFGSVRSTLTRHTCRKAKFHGTSFPVTSSYSGSRQLVSDLSGVSSTCYGEVSDRLATSWRQIDYRLVTNNCAIYGETGTVEFVLKAGNSAATASLVSNITLCGTWYTD